RAPSPPAISTLSLHDALPIYLARLAVVVDDDDLLPPCHAVLSDARTTERDLFLLTGERRRPVPLQKHLHLALRLLQLRGAGPGRSEEHTSELQSPYDLVCRLL